MEMPQPQDPGGRAQAPEPEAPPCRARDPGRGCWQLYSPVQERFLCHLDRQALGWWTLARTQGSARGTGGVRGPTALAWTWEGPDPHWMQLSSQAACRVARAQAKTQPPAR